MFILEKWENVDEMRITMVDILSKFFQHFLYLTCTAALGLGKMQLGVWSGFWPILKMAWFIFFCWVLRVLFKFCTTVLYQVCLLQIFSPTLWASLVILLILFWGAKILILMKFSLLIFFRECVFHVISKKVSLFLMI